MDNTNNIKDPHIKERNNLDPQHQSIFMLKSNQTDLIRLKTQLDIKEEPVDIENYLDVHCINTASKQELNDIRDHFYAKPSKEESNIPLKNEVELTLPQTSLDIEDYLQTYPTDTSLKIEEAQITPIKNEVEFMLLQEFQTVVIQVEQPNIPLKNEMALILPQRKQDIKDYLQANLIDTSLKIEETQITAIKDEVELMQPQEFKNIDIQDKESNTPLKIEVKLTLPQRPEDIEDYLQANLTDSSLKTEEVQITAIKDEVELMQPQEFKNIHIQDKESNTPLKIQVELTLPQRPEDIEDYLQANLNDSSLKTEQVQITPIKDEVELMQPQDFKNIHIQDKESNTPLKIQVELTLPQRPEDIEDYLQANLNDSSLKTEEVQITPIKDEVELMQPQEFRNIHIQDRESNTPLQIQVELTLPQRPEDIEDYLQANITDSFLKIEEVQITPIKDKTSRIQDEPIRQSIVCKDCKQKFQDFCPRCPMLLSVLNVFVKYGTPNRAKLTLPKGLLAFRWDEAVVALRDIPAGVTFGPHEGLNMIEKKHGICKFKVSNKQFSCSKVPEFTNWLQFVNYRQVFNEANLVIIQCKTHLYYRSCRLIKKGEELLVYIDKILVGAYCEPILIGSLNNEFLCKNCCMGFSTRVYLRLHLKVCPQVRVSVSSRDKVSYCKTCNKKFNSGTVLWKHFVTEHAGYKQNSSAKKRKAKSTSSQSKRYNKTISNGRKVGTYEQLNVISPREVIQYKCNYCDHLAETKCVDFVEHMLHKYGD